MKVFFNSCLLLLIIIVCLTACSNKQQQLNKVWFFTNSTDAEDRLELSPVCFIDLQQDGTYSRYFTEFDSGTWMVKENTIELKSTRQQTSYLNIQLLKGNNLMVKLNNSIVNYNFESAPNKFSSEKENPFSVNNNRWRIKALHKETEEEIRQRLKNHCRFWEKYFSWAFDNNISYIDVRSTATPIKIYGNGFTLKPFYNLPDEWKNCFYDDTDVIKANQVIENIFTKKNIEWPQTQNKYKLFISAFQQMQRKL